MNRGRRPLDVRGTPIARHAAAVAAIAVAMCLALTTVTFADGDPASDVLLVDNVFYSYAPAVSPALTQALNTTVARAHAAGYPIKVAMIESPSDLGAIPQLFGRPQQYARYLDVEISFNSVARLLVVMPQGFGTFAAGPVAALSAVQIDAAAKTDGLAAAAIRAIGRLASLAGHPIQLPSVPSSSPRGLGSGGGGRDHARGGGIALVGAVVAAVVVIAVTSTIVVRRR